MRGDNGEDLRPEIRSFLLDVFREDGLYYRAVEEIFAAECLEGGKSQRMAFELRDALDHLAALIAHQTDPDMVKTHSTEVRTHLYRCLRESAEARTERAIMRLDALLAWGTWWWRLFMIRPEVPPKSMRTALKNARELLADGRAEKGDRDRSYEKFTEARGLCERALESAQKADIWGRTGAVVLVLITVFFTWLITFLSMRG